MLGNIDSSITISIVIPCRNEEAYIGACIESVLASEYPDHKLEVLVCDGVSTDRTAEIVREYSEKNSSVRLLVNEERYTPNALNLGIKNAEGSFVMILGAHAVLDPLFLAKAEQLLDEHPDAGCVGGYIENITEGGFSSSVSAAMSSVFGVGNAHFRTLGRKGYVDTVAFGVYRKEVFEKAGLFDEELVRNQDDEYNYRIIQAGYKIYLSDDKAAGYYVRSSSRKLFRQYFQYGYWKVYVNKKHKAVTSIRQLIPAFFVLFLLGGIVVSLFCQICLHAFLAILGLYIALALMAATSKFTVSKNVFYTFYAFLILHIAYGTGYISGVYRFVIRNKKPKHRDFSLTR